MSRNLQLIATGALVAGLGLVACGDDAPIGFPPDGFSTPPPSSFAGTAGATAACVGAGFGKPSAPAGVSPQLTAALVKAETSPPPISGGTLLVSRDGSKLVAADPDRDQVYVVDVATRSLERRVVLHAGDEPGRLVQDAAGRIHVALRGGRGVASFALGGPATDEPRRSEVCDLPRGIAYDARRNQLYVACAEGKLVRVDPATGAAQLKVELGRDLRDVIVHDDSLFVTRFRASELVQVEPDSGAVMGSRRPPSAYRVDIDTTTSSTTCTLMGVPATRTIESDADVVWRAIDVPGQGVALLHQRAENGEVHTSAGGYGGSNFGCGHGIVRGAITLSTGPLANETVDLSLSGLLVDLAVDPTGTLLAVANPAGWGTAASVHVYEVPQASVVQDFAPNPASATACAPLLRALAADGQVTSVAWVAPGQLVAQAREPARIVFYDLSNPADNAIPRTLDLRQPSREDSGHTMFHVTAEAGIACASCHPEGGDDGHTWTFSGIGARRTQSLRGGILGTEPFHWNGDMTDFPMLVDEVFVKRMGGPAPDTERANMLAQWVDEQPALHATAPNAEAVARGKTLFESDELGCVKCHGGARFTNNRSEYVGTGVLVQVPSLTGVSFRAPFFHDGCAKTLAERFGACGGGESHGHTARLSEAQLGDVTAYLESL